MHIRLKYLNHGCPNKEFDLTMQKRLVEYVSPLAEISEETAKEKNIRHGRLPLGVLAKIECYELD